MKTPPFRPRDKLIKESAYERNGRCDHTTEDGAKRSAAMIAQAWAQAGHVVHVPVHQVQYGARMIWAPDLSALPNGLPR
jgi:hypothetical protein